MMRRDMIIFDGNNRIVNIVFIDLVDNDFVVFFKLIS